MGVIPKGIFRVIERVCVDFLWETGGEKKNFHWIRWRDLCYPTEEGGVGFRSLNDTYKALSCKLWWNFRCGFSLWARFLHFKYCKGLYPCQIPASPVGSATWKRMLDIRGLAKLFIGWSLHDGRCNF